MVCQITGECARIIGHSAQPIMRVHQPVRLLRRPLDERTPTIGQGSPTNGEGASTIEEWHTTDSHDLDNLRTVDHLDPSLPICEDPYSSDPTQETCPRPCRFGLPSVGHDAVKYANQNTPITCVS